MGIISSVVTGRKTMNGSRWGSKARSQSNLKVERVQSLSLCMHIPLICLTYDDFVCSGHEVRALNLVDQLKRANKTSREGLCCLLNNKSVAMQP